ncbi:MAG: efflux RND transporter periplasmic adaptor subunit [Bradyrhizobium sp.]|uniref:efflux RND transporter periplasmic adaptor subunit n=1 Tax=Bradyrhizobium sp. TaxID=376 RepID=UPI001D58EF3A|nr:efflux RND transporter periplasmic adaptor subunit [Bradyrhizobium sp.]MBV9566237.1 efflux RND transporter periplasmic adaptor subunit [Bradyrhizobium sp.]
MMKRSLVIASIFAALLAAGCKQETTAPDPVRPVLSMVVEPARSNEAAVAGTVEPRYKSDLGFRVLGRIIARPVDIGDSVHEGQTVAAIDSTALKLGVLSARADLLKSQARLADASAAEERQRKLIVTDAVTKQRLDDAEHERAGAEAAVAAAQANLAKASERLGYAELKAEFAGVVTAVEAEVGQVVSPGQSVVTVARPDVREAVVDIGPDFPVPLKIGLPFTITLQLLPALHIEGQIREIAPQADAVTRTRRVRIALKDPPESFRLGATVTATLSNDQNLVLRVPESAVLAKEDQNFVWVIDPTAHRVSLHQIQFSRDEGGIRVTGGLEAGTRIVTAGIHSLEQEQQVRIDQETAP